jgi:hypothetical protein
MAWYNPVSWFRKKKKKENNPIERPLFYCGMCDRLIITQDMAFDDNNGELYHIGRCAITASGDIAMINNLDTILNVDYIDRPEAIRLYMEGYLKEKPSEEEKTTLEGRMGR